MTFPVLLELGEDGWIVAECPALPGCLSQGKTEDEAVENIKNAIQSWLKVEVSGGRGGTSSGIGSAEHRISARFTPRSYEPQLQPCHDFLSKPTHE